MLSQLFSKNNVVEQLGIEQMRKGKSNSHSKKDRTGPQSFKTICLTSFHLKMMGKVVDDYIKIENLEKTPLHR